GEDQTYTITINNTSTVDAVTVTSLVDDKFGDLLAEAEAANGGPVTLAVGGSFNFDITRELDLNATETHTNTVTVNVVDDDGTTATDSDDDTVTAQDVAPTIMVDKLVDADGDGIFQDSETIVEGTFDAAYQVTIMADADNVSTDPVTVTSIMDDRFGDLLAEAVADNGGADIVLNPGESFTFDFVETLTLDDGELGEDPHVNVLTVTAKDDEGTEASDYDDATINVYSGKGLIAPTGTTCDDYITGKADDFEDYYDFQNGDIQYNGNNKNPGTVNSANPGVFFYYTGLGGGGFIMDDGTGEFTVEIDQENQLIAGSTEEEFPLFDLNADGVKLFEINDLNNNGMIDDQDSCQQVQLITVPKGKQEANAVIEFGEGENLGDVTLTYLDADPNALYVVSLKYETDTVKGTVFDADGVFDPNDAPTINYTFETIYEGILSETDDQGGINLSYKFDPNPDAPVALTLDGSATVGGEALSQDELAPVVDAAIDYWAAQGVDAEGLEMLLKTDVRIEDLGGSLLGVTSGQTVSLDDDAAGYGWSDSLDDVDADEIDLLSVLTHEFGHVLGYDHDVMGDTLAVGERDLPGDDGLDDISLLGLDVEGDLLFG
ncbi:hypothetical protein, partial [Neptunomonas sp.]|uniref:hypothetical protein n=1 Tax=Neptunomonas sp. TaxID=1971898 RepID=UPI003563A979